MKKELRKKQENSDKQKFNPLVIDGLIFLIGFLGLIAYLVYQKYF